MTREPQTTLGIEQILYWIDIQISKHEKCPDNCMDSEYLKSIRYHLQTTTDNSKSTELSKRDWKIIETCLRLRQKELALRKGAAGDYRIFDIQRVLGKIHEQS